MSMVKKSITVTNEQNDWIKAQIKSGHFGNESEVVCELIRERQVQLQETLVEIAAICVTLIEGDNSDVSDMSLEEVWAEAR